MVLKLRQLYPAWNLQLCQLVTCVFQTVTHYDKLYSPCGVCQTMASERIVQKVEIWYTCMQSLSLLVLVCTGGSGDREEEFQANYQQEYLRKNWPTRRKYCAVLYERRYISGDPTVHDVWTEYCSYRAPQFWGALHGQYSVTDTGRQARTGWTERRCRPKT